MLNRVRNNLLFAAACCLGLGAAVQAQRAPVAESAPTRERAEVGVEAGAAPCPWDCGEVDGDVGILDLLALLGSWNGPGECDFDGSGITDVLDLLALLGAWGPCPTCPGSGPCFQENETPGCQDGECCSLVCEVDPFCCNQIWDSLCASEALQLCVLNDVCPGSEPCLQAHETPGCFSTECCNIVCEIDSFCCTNSWDSLCASEAAQVCAGNGACPGTGSCLEPNGTPGCSNGKCCNIVCESDLFCCDTEWDTLCADAAADLCGAYATCPGTEPCFQTHTSPGCMDDECCTIVCSADPFCCETEWDGICASGALSLCTLNDACPGAGVCFQSNGTPGCQDGDCCNIVCEIDLFCCETEWDGLCALEALDLCAGANACPGSEPCFQAHETPGCADGDCCNVVCEVDPFCCSNQWDSICANTALALCAGNQTCPGQEECFQAHESPGCQDDDCCNVVCEIDPFCCDAGWDNLCASEALFFCAGNDVCPGEGGCFTANGTPGCSNGNCCNIVCEVDPFCCDSQWDSICASHAESLCQ